MLNEIQLLLGQVPGLLRLQVDVLEEISISVVLLHFLNLIELILRVEHLMRILIFIILAKVILFSITLDS